MKIKISLFLLLFAYQFNVAADVNHYFSTIKTDPKALHVFLKKMPKGGELHYHLAGGAYPEAMLNLALQDNYCLDKETLAVSKANPCLGITTQALNKHPTLYAKTIRAWSFKDFIPGQESGHDHFFNSFFKFMPIISDYQPELLAEIMRRAANQNELYLEIMIMPDNAKSTTFATQPLSRNGFAAQQRKLLANKAFMTTIQYTNHESARILRQARKNLSCDKKPEQAVCQLTVKFHYYVLREQPLEKVFAQALNGFAAAASSQDIVGINLVQAEDGPISLRDYRQQMQVFHFLHQQYPNVHIALHAGELAPNHVPPEHLKFHIHDALAIGQAERIGHGVAIASEQNSEQLLKKMAENKIAVEINLTSNKKILNISGNKHPLKNYLNHKVPVVLSTDDEGILRTNLTQQYVDAVLQYGLDYSILKSFSRNTITYSFLPGSSLWANAEKAIPVSNCMDLLSTSCLKFINNNEKARLQYKLEKQFIAFEKNYAG